MQFFCPLCILTMKRYGIYLNILRRCKLHLLNFGFLVSLFCPPPPCLFSSMLGCFNNIYSAIFISPASLFFSFFPPSPVPWGKPSYPHFPPTPSVLPLAPLPFKLTDRQTHRSLFLCLSPLKPPSVHSAAWTQCRLFLTQPADRSPELTVSLGLSQCRRAPLCTARGELTPMSEPNE